MNGLVTDLFTLDRHGSITLRGPTDALGHEAIMALDDRGLLPLTAWAVGRTRTELEPAVNRRLGLALAEGRAGALRWQAAIERVVSALEPLRIAPVLLKGADLGFHAYPQPGLRTMTDLDVLVPPERLEDTAAALAVHGFTESTEQYSREWYLHCRGGLPPLVHDGLGVHVDVHTSLLPPYSPFGLDLASTLENARPSIFPGALRLSPEVSAWHLAVHCFVIHLGAVDARERARVDLLALTARDELSVDVLEKIARRTRTEWALRRALRLIRDVPLGDRLSAALDGRKPGREWVWRTIHTVRHVLPFIGSGRPIPPDAWAQFGRRARRLTRSLGEQ